MEVRKLVLLVVPVLAMAAPPVAAQEFATHYHELADLTHTKRGGEDLSLCMCGTGWRGPLERLRRLSLQISRGESLLSVASQRDGKLF